MSSEISLTSRLTATKSSVAIAVPSSGSKTVNMAASSGFGASHTARGAVNMVHRTQDVATREAVDLGDVDNSYATGNEYWLEIWNRDATNYLVVEVKTGASTYQVVARIRPGEPFGPIRCVALDSNGYGGYYLTASASTVQAEVGSVEAGDPDA